MNRVRFSIAIAVLVALAAALVACGGGDSSNESPQTVIDEATLQGIQSGVIDLSLAVDAKGKEGGDLDVSLAGPFQEGSGGNVDLPEFDLTAKADGSVNGQAVDFDGGLVFLANSAYVNYEGVDYEVDPTTFSFVESIIEPPTSGGAGRSSSLTACQEAIGELKPADFADNLRNGGEADVGGTSTTKVSGDLDATSAIDSLIDLTEDPACKAQLSSAGPVPSTSELEKSRDDLEESLKSAKVDVYVGDDDIVRRISAQLKIDPPESAKKGPTSADVDFDLQLTEVNEEPEIAAPQGAKPLGDLFLKLNINPLELLGLLEGEEADVGGLLEKLGKAGGSGGGK